MPALATIASSWKAKASNKAATIRAPFSSLLRSESSSATTSTATVPAAKEPEVLDIKDRSSISEASLDFSGGRPTSGFTDLVHTQRTESPQVKLELDVSPEGLSDWFAANWLPPEAPSTPPVVQSTSSLGTNPISAEAEEATRQDVLQAQSGIPMEEYEPVSDDVLASLRAMDASNFAATDEPETEGKRERPRSRALPKPLTIPSSSPGAPSPTSGRSRPFSIFDTPASSAVSGTTLARALLSNTFSLSSDNRSSRYRSGAMGLTRSDSATLPRGDHPFFADRFSPGPDAPPLPDNAEALYKAPKRTRGEPKRSPLLKRHGSSDSIDPPRRLPTTPSTSSPQPAAQPFENDDDEEPLAPPRPMFAESNSIQVSPASPRPPLPFPPTATRQTPSRSPLIQYNNRDSHPISYDEAVGLKDTNSSDDVPSSAVSDVLSPALSAAPSSLASPPGRLDDVLDYYQTDRTESTTPEPTIGGTYRPAVSPISEEQSAQLSPPGPYRERRESRTQPLGARRPSTGSPRNNLRSDSAPGPRRPAGARLSTRQLSLRPIGERPQSIQSIIEVKPVEPPSPTGTNGSGSVYSVDSEQPESVDHHTIMKRFSRDRASIPPIQVVRDSQSLGFYDIKTPNTLSTSASATPTAKDGVFDAQQFPQTPSEFSPAPTREGEATFEGPRDRDGQQPVPSTPTGPSMTKSTPPASLAQQVLLHRTASSSPVVPNQPFRADGSPSNRSSISQFSAHQSPQPLGSPLSATFNPMDLPHHDKRVSSNSLEPPASVVSRSSSRGGQMSDAGSMYTSSSHGTSPRPKNLPIIPISPLFSHHHNPSISSTRSMSSDHSLTPAVSISEHNHSPQSNISPSTHHRSPSSPSLSPAASPQVRNAPARPRLPAAITINNRYSGGEEFRPVAVNDHDSYESPLASAGPVQSNSPVPASPTGSQVSEGEAQSESQPSLRYKNDAFTGRPPDIFRGTSLGSPPPYYTVVSDTPIMRDAHMQATTPRSGNNTIPPSSSSTTNLGLAPSISEGPPSSGDRNPQLTRENSMIGIRGSRGRPPLPAGPRRPSQQQLLNPFANPQVSKEVENEPDQFLRWQATDRQRQRGNLGKVPPPKWRGYPMEATKWTFTSSQLQEIVSRAIRQSAEASSIRVLPQDVLDNEIATEIRRLESQRTDLKTRYKVLTRRRTTMFESLTHQLSTPSDDHSAALRLTEDLREMATTLDRLAEELHSLDEQLSYLYSLIHVHNGSALAMALRKLNSRLLTQTHENQVLRDQVATLEAERDEAWQQAENVAREFDSQRVFECDSVECTKPATRIPPVPPIPTMPRSAMPPMVRPRPLDLNTPDPVTRSSVFSAGVNTPSSEARALVQAENEVYSMLGLAPPSSGLRRSVSAAAIRPESTPAGSALPGLLAGLRSSEIHSPNAGLLSPGRRASLPPDSALVETYNIMAADRHAVLATIDMLSSTEP